MDEKNGCCGGPAAEETNACCAKDADAKAAGEAGCGCGAPSHESRDSETPAACCC